jgi:geranylgeranyl pyrophosphate synthase
MYAGLRAAGFPGGDLVRRTANRTANAKPPAWVPVVRSFCRFVGVAFQVLNDLEDWREDGRNKVVAGRDALTGHPTILRAFALEAGPLPACDHLPPAERTDSLRALYEERGAFDRGRRLLNACRRRALAQADRAGLESLRELMRFILEIVL